MFPTSPTDVVQDAVTAYRREGYAERLLLNFGAENVSFGPGQYAVQLEIYPANAQADTVPIKVIPHQIGADPTEAIMVLTPADLLGLRSTSYGRKVVLTSPQGEVFILVDGQLNPKS